MAYTYENFTSAAQKAGMLDKFSEQDLQTAQKNPEYGLSLLSLMQDGRKATTVQQRLLATETANQLRKNYGVYNTGNLNDGTGAYVGSYGSKINDLMEQATQFSYDPETDPVYASYQKQYMREGERASANALAQASANSGGRASSYATMAAQQAGDYYASKLSDKIPTLAEDAYNRLISNLNNYQAQDNTDYQRYLNAVNQALTEKQYADALAQQQTENELAAQKLALSLITSSAGKENSKNSSGGNSGGVSSTSGNTGGNQYGGALYNFAKDIQKDVTKTGNSGKSNSGANGLDTNDGTLDMASVLALGYGPIDADELAELVAEGKVEVYQDGNLIKARKVENSFGKVGNTLSGSKIPAVSKNKQTQIHGGTSGKF